MFFEKYLSEFKVYIGQHALLFSQLQGIAEVYKIHGSLNDPQTIVINEKDYKEFKEKRYFKFYCQMYVKRTSKIIKR